MPIHHGLPQIRISDFDILKKPVDRATAVAANATADWDVGVKALGDTIPGYRYSASKYHINVFSYPFRLKS